VNSADFIDDTNVLTCSLCVSTDLHRSVSFGLQPPSNRYVSGPNVADEKKYALTLGFCGRCGTIQLIDRMPIEVIRPRYDWLSHNEPEGHLDDVAERLRQLPGVHSQSAALGVTYKDQSTLVRLERLGLAKAYHVRESDFLLPKRPFGLETIQNSLSDSRAIEVIKKKYGAVDLLVVRHVVEHAVSARQMLKNLQRLLSPSGYMVLEMPDSEHIFNASNHSFIWEEHISYFTEASIRKIAQSVSAKVIWAKRYKYPYEDSLVFVLKFDAGATDNVLVQSRDEVQAAKKHLASFAKALLEQRKLWRDVLEGYRQRGQKVAVFGAGHLAAKFLNFLQVGDFIDCVVDDDPNKIGSSMPGSHVTIVSSSDLTARGIEVCVSTLSPESEVRVRNKLEDFFLSGGIFLPAFLAQ